MPDIIILIDTVDGKNGYPLLNFPYGKDENNSQYGE